MLGKPREEGDTQEGLRGRGSRCVLRRQDLRPRTPLIVVCPCDEKAFCLEEPLHVGLVRALSVQKLEKGNVGKHFFFFFCMFVDIHESLQREGSTPTSMMRR